VSAVDPRAVLQACVYISLLPIPSPQFEIGRTLLELPEYEWVRFLTAMACAFPIGSPQHTTASQLRRIVVDGEVSAA
jgi:hypothetical protein